MNQPEVSRLERAIEDMGRELKADIASLRRDAGAEIARLRKDVSKATDFQTGFQAISKGLTYVFGIVAACAVIYGAFFRK